MGTKTQKLSNVVDQIVEWQSVVTADGSTGLTAVAGRGYFIDTTSGAITVTLPASPKIGDTITIADYASTFATNNVTINPNGGKIQNSTENGVLADNNASVSFVYIDSTKGWKQTSLDTSTPVNTPLYVTATGGTVTESTDYKIHTFTGDGCFVVSCAGNVAGSNSVDYLVIAGGGGGSGAYGGGGGAGGYRFSNGTVSGCYTAGPAPLGAPALNVSTTTYPITVGGGGSGGPAGCGPAALGTSGSSSIFSTITSTGGGRGAVYTTSPTPDSNASGAPGGSGGGGGGWDAISSGPGGTGNTPPVSPPQGNDGGSGGRNPVSFTVGGGGGGASAVGCNLSSPGPNANGGNGGAGLTSCITATPVGRGGGGGGASNANLGGTSTDGGGDGFDFVNTPTPGSGTANTGGGGGGAGTGPSPSPAAGSGGKGIVVIRYKFQN